MAQNPQVRQAAALERAAAALDRDVARRDAPTAFTGRLDRPIPTSRLMGVLALAPSLVAAGASQVPGGYWQVTDEGCALACPCGEVHQLEPGMTACVPALRWFLWTGSRLYAMKVGTAAEFEDDDGEEAA